MRGALSVVFLGLCFLMMSGCGLKPSQKRDPQLPQTAVPTPMQARQPWTTPRPVPIDRSAQLVVIGYHRVVDKVRHPDTEIDSPC